jgi:hypothetical protein
LQVAELAALGPVLAERESVGPVLAERASVVRASVDLGIQCSNLHWWRGHLHNNYLFIRSHRTLDQLLHSNYSSECCTHKCTQAEKMRLPGPESCSQMKHLWAFL